MAETEGGPCTAGRSARSCTAAARPRSARPAERDERAATTDAERRAEIEQFAEHCGYDAEEIMDVLMAFADWQVRQRAARIREGLAARKARGERVGGRAPGSKDRVPRESMRGNQNAAGKPRKRDGGIADNR